MDREVFVQNIEKYCAQNGVKPTNACRDSGVGASLATRTKAKSLGITEKTSDTKAFLRFLNLLLLPVTTSYSQLREHSREHSHAPRYMSCRRLTSAALSICFSCR